ncbi:hypothetical protein Lal_00031300 [Lupinus albus]|nr:hypothetical protein Lal_00031300 [Lupinus albus]
MEQIFWAMNYLETQKLAYATYMLVKEAENWWEFTRRQMLAEGQLIASRTFKAKFLHKYFPADLKRKKEMEFLKLEQGNMSVGEYTAKFKELARFCPYSELEVDGRSKCSKFELGLRPKLKRMFGHQEIADFANLVNKCRMYEDNMKVNEVATPKSIFPRNSGPQRNHMQGRGKERVEDDRNLMRHLLHIVTEISRVETTYRSYRRGFYSMCNKCGRFHYESTCLGSGNG